MKRQCAIWLLFFAVTLASCANPNRDTMLALPSSELSAIDTLMQSRPDSALKALYSCTDTSNVSGHYYQLLLSEAFYKNDSAQLNRPKLLHAMAYFDSIGDAFLSARCHYMNGVGYYEMDSVVPACDEYMKALEIMESHFEERDLMGYKAKFMALAYTHLCVLFSDQYLHEQAIYFGKCALCFYNRYDAEPWHIAWILNYIGSHYDMMEQYDSAEYYYHKTIEVLPDTNNLMYRIAAGHLAFLVYTKDNDKKQALSQLYRLLNLADNEKEFLSGCLSIGEIYYEQNMYDSAWVFLTKVFNESESIASKKQAAEWLSEICKAQGKADQISKYTTFLIPFANQNENNSTLKSELGKFHSTFIERKLERSYQQKIKVNIKRISVLIGLILVVIIVVVLLYLKNKRHKLHLEKQFIEKQQAYETEQKKLKKKLKQNDEILRKLTYQVKQQEVKTPLKDKNKVSSFMEEKICQHIINVCNDTKRPIKSSIPVSEYADIALTNKQKAQLFDAAVRHYDWFFDKLKKEHPDLKEKDMTYCYLCLLGLNNVQIAALLQKTQSTIWDREKRLQVIFGKKEDIRIVLQSLLISK